MKNILLASVILFVLVGFAPVPVQAACPPPGLPSSFWGYITANVPVVGQPMVIFDQGVVIASAQIFSYSGKAVYTVNVPADDPCRAGVDGGVQNDILSFNFNGRIVLSKLWHGGTNVRADISIFVPLRQPIALPINPVEVK